jgi:hypothetical protein
MNWIDATIKFPSEPSPIFEGLTSRYGASTEGVHYIDGVAVEFSYAQPHGITLAVGRDNYPLTRFYRVAVESSTPIEDSDGAYLLHCCWPETFLAALSLDPQPDPELVGIEILPPPSES